MRAAAPPRLTGPAKSCPRCRSSRVHRSHRRSLADRIWYALGAEIRRCHQCRLRHACFLTFSVPIIEPSASAHRRTARMVLSSGFLVALLFVWWMIRRFTELSG